MQGFPEASILGTMTGCAWSWHAESLKLQFWLQGPGTQCLGSQCPVMLGLGTQGAGTVIRCCHLGVPETPGPCAWQLGAWGPDGGEVQHRKSLWLAVTIGRQQRGKAPLTVGVAGKQLTAQVLSGVWGQSGCCCCYTSGLCCTPFKVTWALGSILPSLGVPSAVARALLPGDPFPPAPEIPVKSNVPHSPTHTTHAPVTPLLTRSPSLSSCYEGIIFIICIKAE